MERIEANARDAKSRREAVSRAAAALRDGRIVALATETIYGAFAGADQGRALERLRSATKTDGPLTAHLAAPAVAESYLPNGPILAKRIARRGWPGPLTLAFGGAESGAQTVLRCPQPGICVDVARELGGVGLMGGSAVRREAGFATNADLVASSSGDFVDLLIDEGTTTLRSPSTVLEFDGDHWKVTRAGPIEERLIRRWIDGLVLFVCTGNTCRSPMAEGMFRAAYERATQAGRGAARVVASCGTSGYPGLPLSSGSAEELRRRGIDGGRHRSHSVTVELLQAADRIFTMTERHRRAVIDLAPACEARVSLLDGARDIADPFGQDQEAYARCAGQIESAVHKRVEELLDEDRRWE